MVAITNTMTLVAIDACASFTEEVTRTILYASSVDSEKLAMIENPHDRAEMPGAYERYVIEIVIFKHKTGWFDPMMTTGCSMALLCA